VLQLVSVEPFSTQLLPLLSGVFPSPVQLPCEGSNQTRTGDEERGGECEPDLEPRQVRNKQTP
jgi:hypothetical protein